MLAALVLLLGLALLIGWEILCLGQVIQARFLVEPASPPHAP